MHFGKVPENEVNSIDFSLPPDPPGNALVLPGEPVPKALLYVGCAREDPNSGSTRSIRKEQRKLISWMNM